MASLTADLTTITSDSTAYTADQTETVGAAGWDIGADEATFRVPTGSVGLSGYAPGVVVSAPGAWDIGADEAQGISGIAVPRGTVTITGHVPTITVPAFVPSPTNVAATATGTTSATVTWTKNASYDESRIYWRVTGETTWTVAGVVTAGEQTFDVEYLPTGTQVDLGVSHHDGANESVIADDDTTTWIAPGLGSVAITERVPTVSVTAPSITVPTRAVAITGFVPTVTAANPTSVTVPAGTVTLTGYAPAVGVGTLIAPGALAASVTGDTVTLTWSDTNGGAYPYLVKWQRVGSSAAYELVVTTAVGAETATVRYLVPGVEYSFEVRAYDTPIEGPPSYVSATGGTVLSVRAAFI